MSAETRADVTERWNRYELVLTGLPADIARFRDAARGPGGVPWPLDADHQHTTLMARLMAGAGGAPLPRHAEDLLRAIAQAQEARHARLLVACASPGGGCLLDLNRLLPVPAGLLAWGPDHGAALDWLDRHWGTREAVRQIDLQETRDPRRHSRRRLRFRFWMLDGRPATLAASLLRAWPELEVTIRSLELPGG
ncbi:hypothetical protein FHR90_003228 [Endobacter medicaginis]|uniref:Uncharacterized protein n=2 Tax=Endobacter medicaginis TaxID=1181271 RepID=A0A839V3L7_9PROT|nr:hypothetical protein [Endobacter medicaginis]MBB3175373.1 hypothetical protein [Endobacter medicaginis]MCX5476900.1 hypothetical protein [Endobacter medicaginis]